MRKITPLLTPPAYIQHFGRVAARTPRAAQELARAALDRDCDAVAMHIADEIDARLANRLLGKPAMRSQLASAIGTQISSYDELQALLYELRDCRRSLHDGAPIGGVDVNASDVELAGDITLARLWLRCIVGLAIRHPQACERALAGNLHRYADAARVRSAGQLVDIIPWVATDVQLEPDWCAEDLETT